MSTLHPLLLDCGSYVTSCHLKLLLPRFFLRSDKFFLLYIASVGILYYSSGKSRLTATKAASPLLRPLLVASKIFPCGRLFAAPLWGGKRPLSPAWHLAHTSTFVAIFLDFGVQNWFWIYSNTKKRLFYFLSQMSSCLNPRTFMPGFLFCFFLNCWRPILEFRGEFMISLRPTGLFFLRNGDGSYPVAESWYSVWWLMPRPQHTAPEGGYWCRGITMNSRPA